MLGHYASRHCIPEEGTGFRPEGLAVATRGGGSLTGRKGGLLLGTHRSFLPLQQVPRQLFQPLRLRSTGWDSPIGRKPTGRDTGADRSRGKGWREAGRAAWAAELAPLQQTQDRQ
jgi:hypothetical protein